MTECRGGREAREEAAGAFLGERGSHVVEGRRVGLCVGERGHTIRCGRSDMS
jgi:hypothetical protein